MKRFFVLAVAAVLCGTSASAETAVIPETVVLAPYPGIIGWKKITDVSNAEHVYFEWIPANQSAERFHDILVEQSYTRLKNVPPGAFAEKVIAVIAQACAKTSKNGPKLVTEHGSQVAYAQYYCVADPKKEDVDGFIKVITGRDALYIFQREFHYPTTAESYPGVRSWPKGHDAEAKADMEAHFAAAKYLDAVQLCPAADGSACPSAQETPESGAVPR